jgi:hypothetical protein
MKTTFLSTAAVLASVTLAAAQMSPQKADEKPAPGASSERSQPNAAGQGRGEQLPQRDSRPADREKDDRSQPAPRADQKEKKPGSADKASDDVKRDAQQKPTQGEAQKSDTKQDTKRDQERNTGQNRPDPNQKAQDQREQGKRDQVQDSNRQPGTTQQSPTAQQKDSPSGTQDRVRADAQGRVTLNSEQRTRIQQTVFARSDVPRVSRVDFNISVGTNVPAHVTIVEVPPALVELNPEWRGHRYFVVEEEIIVVTPERRIVAVVPVGQSRAGSSGGATVTELPEAEVRILQQVLVERGFAVEVDGVWGPRTREALISFQRREGLQATGQIDTRTVTALGVQGRVNVQSETDTKADQQSPSGKQQQPTAQQPGSPQPTQQQGNQRPGDEQQRTTGSGDTRRDRQPETPARGSESGKQPEPQRSGAPAGEEPRNRQEQRPAGTQK